MSRLSAVALFLSLVKYPLGHNVLLFLDELPEFELSALEVLRQTIEDRISTIASIKSTSDYSVSLMLIQSTISVI
jgi:magnesium chelatase family protein